MGRKPRFSLPIEVLTRQRLLRVGAATFPTRSVAAFRFLALLWQRARERGKEAWVSLREVGLATGTATHARQMQRLVDYLEAAQAGLLAWETRTRGPWRLGVAPERLSWDVEPKSLLASHLSDSPIQPSEESPDKGHSKPGDRSLLDMLAHLLHADSAVNDGGLRYGRDAAIRAQAILNDSVAVDTDWERLIALRLAHLDMRQGRYSEMRRHLPPLGSNDDPFEATLALRRRLILAKSHYDRGHYAEAERVLAAETTPACNDLWTLGRYYNLRGLLAYRQWRNRPRADTATALETIAALYRRALLYQCHVGDYPGIQAVAFNLANAYLHPVRHSRGMPDSQHQYWAHLGLSWLGICRYTCAHFFVGLDSVWGHVLALETALATEMSFPRLNAATGGMFGNLDSLHAAAAHTLEMARRIGDPAEIKAATAIARRIERIKQYQEE